MSMRRGKETIDSIGILTFFPRILSHDFRYSYFNDDSKYEHAMCHAHLLRELQAMFELYRKKCLLYIALARKNYSIKEKTPGKRGRPAKGKVRCLLDRLYNHVDDILRLAIDTDATSTITRLKEICE